MRLQVAPVLQSNVSLLLGTPASYFLSFIASSTLPYKTGSSLEIQPSDVPYKATRPIYDSDSGTILLSRSNTLANALPRRFKTAYIFYTVARHREIRQEVEAKGGSFPKVSISGLVVTASHGRRQRTSPSRSLANGRTCLL